MPTRLTYLAAFAALLLAAPAALAQLTDADRDQLAERIVTQSAGVEAGEIVVVAGAPRDMHLLEDLAVHVRRQGAFPLLLVGTDRLTKRMYDDVPAELDDARDEANRMLMENVDVMLTVDGNETPGLLAHVDAARFEARTKANKPNQDLFRERGIRLVNIGNGMYPAAFRAERHKMKQDDLAKMFWKGVGTDYEDLSMRAKAVKKALMAGKTVHITHDNGTDIRFEIAGREVHTSDGSISEADRAAGNRMVWLPAGEVYVTPVPGTAQGRVVSDELYERGQRIENLVVEFKDGKVASMTADSGLDLLQQRYDAAGEGRDHFAFLDIGINPHVRPPSESRMTPWMADGMVTVGIGENLWAGGENDASFARPLHLPGATVTVDGKPLVSGGSLEMAAR